MKLNRKSGAKLAMSAAVLVVTGATLIGAAMAETVKGRCFGVNGCKGQGNCKRAPRMTARARTLAKARVGSRCSRPIAPTSRASGKRSKGLDPSSSLRQFGWEPAVAGSHTP